MSMTAPSLPALAVHLPHTAEMSAVPSFAANGNATQNIDWAMPVLG